ncbi:MAG: CRISPR-associated protein Cas4 [Firmicutes bacterium]|mgnify:FL=1|nr:CRISPR-associated protein Cas4 [Bacillota bacterium]
MDSEDYLQLAGIQRYAFCPRQWGLVHLEGHWQENVLTYGGQKLHRNVNNPEFLESRGDVIVSRSVPVRSHRLRLYGIADMVEFIRDEANGIKLAHRAGRWRPLPVEYKYGQSKLTSCDRVQLCAQAMCLEETFDMDLHEGHIFYGRPRRREVVLLSDELRQETREVTEAMYGCQNTGVTPPPEYGKHCERCSLVEVCVPSLSQRQTVSQYLERML